MSLARILSPVFIWFAVTAGAAASHGASTGLVLTSSMHYGDTILPNTAAYSAIKTIRIEAQFDTYEAQKDAVTGIVEIDSNLSIVIDKGNTLVVTNAPCTESLSIPLAGVTAAKFAFTLDSPNSTCLLELFNSVTGAYTYAVSASTGPAINIANRRIKAGSFYEPTSPNMHLAFIRACSSIQPSGTVPPQHKTRTFCNLWDWEFEGNLNDSSGHKIQAAFSTSAGARSPETYAPPAKLKPLINIAGIKLSVRAGKGNTLAGSRNMDRFSGPAAWAMTDDGVLTYSWSTVSGPGSATFSSSSDANPVFTPAAVFGTYNLGLQIVDSAGAASSATFKVGSVISDDNGVVQIPDANIAKLLGPSMHWGMDPWTWRENREKAYLELVQSSLPTYWQPWWETTSPGTITCVEGGNTCTGDGASFASTVCAGGNNTIIQYPSRDYKTPGRGLLYVSGCSDDRHFKLSKPFNFPGAGGIPMKYAAVPQTTLAYFKGIGGGSGMGRITFNYYGTDVAAYRLYYRTGIDDYLTLARTIADLWWTSPYVDRGMAFIYDPSGEGYAPGFWNPESRSTAALGLLVRALDGKPEMFTGLGHLWKEKINQLDGAFRGQISDHREEGFGIDFLAACAQVDSAHAPACLAGLRHIADYTLTPRMRPGAPYLSTISTFAGYSNNPAGWPVSTVRVIDGSPVVKVISGTACWASGCPIANVGGLSNTPHILFGTFGTAVPASNAHFDKRAYNFSVVSDSQINLTEPYNSGGQCSPPMGCTKGWQAGSVMGFGELTYMVGVFTAGLQRAANAFTQAGDGHYSSKYEKWAHDMAVWITTTGYHAEWRGVYNARDAVGCEPPGADTPVSMSVDCQADKFGARLLVGEVTPGIAFVYAANPSAAASIAPVMDSMYSGLFAKPGWGHPPVATDGVYLTALNDGPGNSLVNTNGVFNNFEQIKYYGFFFGYGGPSWAAARSSAAASVTSK